MTWKDGGSKDWTTNYCSLCSLVVWKWMLLYLSWQEGEHTVAEVNVDF